MAKAKAAPVKGPVKKIPKGVLNNFKGLSRKLVKNATKKPSPKLNSKNAGTKKPKPKAATKAALEAALAATVQRLR